MSYHDLCDRVHIEMEKQNSRSFPGYSYIFQGLQLTDSLHLILQYRVLIVVVINTSTSPDIINLNMSPRHHKLKYVTTHSAVKTAIFFYFYARYIIFSRENLKSLKNFKDKSSFSRIFV